MITNKDLSMYFPDIKPLRYDPWELVVNLHMCWGKPCPLAFYPAIGAAKRAGWAAKAASGKRSAGVKAVGSSSKNSMRASEKAFKTNTSDAHMTAANAHAMASKAQLSAAKMATTAASRHAHLVASQAHLVAAAEHATLGGHKGMYTAKPKTGATSPASRSTTKPRTAAKSQFVNPFTSVDLSGMGTGVPSATRVVHPPKSAAPVGSPPRSVLRGKPPTLPTSAVRPKTTSPTAPASAQPVPREKAASTPAAPTSPARPATIQHPKVSKVVAPVATTPAAPATPKAAPPAPPARQPAAAGPKSYSKLAGALAGGTVGASSQGTGTSGKAAHQFARYGRIGGKVVKAGTPGAISSGDYGQLRASRGAAKNAKINGVQSAEGKAAAKASTGADKASKHATAKGGIIAHLAAAQHHEKAAGLHQSLAGSSFGKASVAHANAARQHQSTASIHIRHAGSLSPETVQALAPDIAAHLKGLKVNERRGYDLPSGLNYETLNWLLSGGHPTANDHMCWGNTCPPQSASVETTSSQAGGIGQLPVAEARTRSEQHLMDLMGMNRPAPALPVAAGGA